MIRSNALRSTTRSLTTGNALARHGSIVDRVAVLEAAHVELADGGAAVGPVRDAVDHQAAHAADALAAVGVERDRVLALAHQAFVDDVEHFEERHVRRDVGGRVVLETAGGIAAGLSPDFEVQSHDLAQAWLRRSRLVRALEPTCSSAASGALPRRPAAPCAARAAGRRP